MCKSGPGQAGGNLWPGPSGRGALTDKDPASPTLAYYHFSVTFAVQSRGG